MMFISMAVLVAFIFVNIFYASILKTHLRSGEDISVYSNNSDYKTIIKARRGTIYDSTQTVIAEDVTSYNLVAYLSPTRVDGLKNPHYVVNVDETAQLLSNVLGGEVSYYVELLNRGAEGRYQTEFGRFGKGLSLTQKTEIEASGLPGLEFTETSKRHYPLGQFASQLIGFSNVDQELGQQIGQMGIELLYNDELTGKDGESISTLTLNGYKLPNANSTTINAENGNDIYLTLNKNVQLQLEESLAQSMELSNTDKAWALVMDVKTGKIIATSQAPSFDPEIRDGVEYLFYPMSFEFEPGSTLKAIMYAAAIEEGFDIEQKFNSKTIRFNFDSTGRPYRTNEATPYAPIQNASGKDWGEISFAQGFEASSNVGMVEMASRGISSEILEQYFERFKFFQPTKLDNIKGTAGHKLYNYPIEKLNNTFGQGSTVTMLQMASAYQAIVNDGIQMQPYIIDQIVDDNEVIFKNKSEEIGRPISPETSAKMRELMSNVVYGDLATGSLYKLDEIEIIAKTGTAQVVIDGQYSKDRYINSIGAAFPKEDPEYLVFYAYESEYDITQYRAQAEPINNLILKVSDEFNLIKTENNSNAEPSEDDIIISRMPSLTNHSLDYAKAKLDPTKAKVIIIGEGQQIINQYPMANTKIMSNQKLILYTGKGKITLPDMTGWSRKEVVAFWEASGAEFVIEGIGNVYYQSLPIGSIIDENSEVIVKLR